MVRNKYCIAFAGAIGSSKTPIAHYLSYSYNLPIFSTDTIRTEVAEDMGKYDEEEFEKRRTLRVKMVIEKGNSFIYDCSVDRDWPKLKNALNENGFDWFVISLDLRKDFLLKLYGVKGYKESAKRIDKLVDDHNQFLKEHVDDVNVRVNDANFLDRLAMVSGSLQKWLEI